MNWLKENLPVILLGIGLFIGYVELRLPPMVANEMAKQGLASNSAVSDLREDLAEQKVIHKEDRDRMDGKIERIVSILLEE